MRWGLLRDTIAEPLLELGEDLDDGAGLHQGDHGGPGGRQDHQVLQPSNHGQLSALCTREEMGFYVPEEHQAAPPAPTGEVRG